MASSVVTDATAVGGLALPIAASTNGRAIPTGFERFEVREELARGGCGHVFRAYDRQLDREVVLKKLLPEASKASGAIARFLHEAKITGALTHPGIVPVYEVGFDETNQLPFYAMKWLHGKTLATVLTEYHQLAPGKLKRIAFRDLIERFLNVCQTLAYAHQNGIVHRDLKPANVLIGEFAETVVLDWGLAKQLSAGSADAQTDQANIQCAAKQQPPCEAYDLTIQGAVMGTASYMSPEQARGDVEAIDYRSDVFSLGVILYEIITGCKPFSSESTQLTLARVMTATYVPAHRVNPRAPRALVAICEKSLAAHPEDRYPDAFALAADIDRYLAGEAVDAAPEPWWLRLDRIASNHRSIFWSIFVSVILIATLSIVATATIATSHQHEKEARQLAQSEHLAMTKALDEEHEAHNEAVTQLQSAREAIDSWLYDLSSDLDRYPGTQILRTQLLQKAQNHYRLLAQTRPLTPVLSLEVARARAGLGDLDLLTQNLAEADSQYEQSAELIEDLRSHPNREWNDVATLQLAQVRIGQARVALARKDFDRSKFISQEAVQLAETIDEESTEYPTAQRVWAEGKRVLARALSECNDFQAACQIVWQCLAALKRVEKDPLDPTFLQRCLPLYHDLAAYQEKSGNATQAAIAYTRIIETYDSLIQKFGNRPDWLQGRAEARLGLGTSQLEVQHSNEAIIAFEGADEDLHRARKLFDTEVSFHERFSQVYSNLGHAYVQSSEMEQAEQVLHRGIESLDYLRQVRGDLPDIVAKLAQSMIWLAMAIEHRQPEQLEALLGSIAKTIDRLPSNSCEHLPLLHAQRLWLDGRRCARSQDWQKSLDACQAGERQIRSMPNDESPLIGLKLVIRGRLYALASRAFHHLGNPSEADRLRGLARNTWEECRQKGSDRYRVMASISEIEFSVESDSLHHDDEKRLLQLANQLVEKHETLPTAYRWQAEAELKNRLYESARSSIAKAKRLRRHFALEDELIDTIAAIAGGDHSTATQARAEELLAHPRPSDLHSASLHDRLSQTLAAVRNP